MERIKFNTLARHIYEEERNYPEATGELSDLLHDLSLAAKVISLEVNKAGLVDILGFTGDENVHGEQVKKLDIFAHEMMIKAMDHGGHLCVMASEEEEDIIHIPEEFHIGKYVLLFDPLDGSSNIDANVSIGTIFSIYRRISPEDGPGYYGRLFADRILNRLPQVILFMAQVQYLFILLVMVYMVLL